MRARPARNVRWSVLLPTHNRPDTLALSIESTLRQSDDDWELLVVGDGCTDDTADVVASFDDPRIRWFDLPKAPGLGYANRRHALGQATGGYLALASHDDLWAPDHLAVLGTLLDAGASLAYSMPFWATPSGRLVPLPFDLRDSVLGERFATANYIPATFVAFDLRAVAAAGGWPIDVEAAADWNLMQRILALPGATVGYSTAATALFFRSIERDRDHFTVNAILRADRVDEWWPQAAQVRPETGRTLQAVIAQASDSPEWWAALASAASAIEAHLAFTATELIERTERLEAERSAALREIELVHAAYGRSTSWRLTAPLRAMGSLFAKRA
jgi:glycosyltransferase involved in cell wall biosynthesis